MGQILPTRARSAALLALLAVSPHEAWAQYIAIDLHSSAYVHTEGLGIGDGEQAGQSQSSPPNGQLGVTHALLWRGSAASVIDLHPDGFKNSGAFATSGGVQVGYGVTASATHALKWSGSASSVVDLDPTAVFSQALGIAGDQVVGFGDVQIECSVGACQHARLWTSSGVVDLNPSGFLQSQANATDGASQAGWGFLTGRGTHALLWAGTADSFVDLNPAGYSGSVASGVSGGQQVGTGFVVSSGASHALLWTGSAASVVDLHPSGFFETHALGVAAGRQVGWGFVTPNGPTHALLWNGSANSVVDLHAFLPPGFAASRAFGIDAAGNVIGAAGDVTQAGEFPGHAILWLRLRPRADFSGEGRSDILWRNVSTGENYLYFMSGTSIGGEGFLRTVADLDWKIAGVGDFDGDGKSDILWRNSSTGENYIYLMNGTTIVGEGFIRTVADQNWQVASVGDFDGDGKSDILWRNAATGEAYIYLMSGLTIAGEGFTRTVADQNWKVAGVADFDGDGKSDILWRNSSTGQNYVYPMNGTAIKPSEGYLRTVADLNWNIVGAGDLDGDGRADIVWRNSATGENYLYPMDGTTIKSTEGFLRTVADLNWHIAAVGDYDGDGKTDLFWRNSSTGENYIYPMDGTTIKPTEGYVRTVPVEWSVIGR
jgi:hypothetical protein